jgi:signal transduction histidine kinase
MKMTNLKQAVLLRTSYFVPHTFFQHFFTTKPTGQGTGLGLSLSYDIVKAHGGELKVETKEGEGSAFVIQLPSRIEGI